MMNILYVSTLCSKAYLEYKARADKRPPVYSMQKFNRLLCEGFVANRVNVTTLTSIPCSRETSSRIFIYEKSQIENGVKYQYVFTINLPLLKNLLVLIISFCKTLLWCLRNKGGVVICDVLQVSAALGALGATKLLSRKICGIVTDIPGLMVGGKNNKGFVANINKAFINRFDSYILLTEYMNEVVNKYNRPYIIMEGLVDINMKEVQRTESLGARKLMYAGGLYERYGLKMLIDAFIELNPANAELHLYGNGNLVTYIQEVALSHSSVVYHGAVTNDVVVTAELDSYLLINPRPTHELFARYSFPSKNMEYMVSGIPVLTTLLLGMPSEYYPYVLLFDKGETKEGYKQSLALALEMSPKQMFALGQRAKHFVLQEKNNISQSKRIISFLK